MGKSNASPASPASRAYDPCKGRPYNRYNIYYILERERFLQSFPGYRSERSRTKSENDPRRRDILTGYEELQQELPPLAPRYERLELPHDWYMPGKRKMVKRDHKKSHGVATFQEIAKFVADGWKTIDDETLKYCTEVARVLKRRHGELKEMGGLKRYAEERLARRGDVPTPKAPPKAGAENGLAPRASARPLLTASLTAASDPEPPAVTPVPTMEDFVFDAPPFPKAASDPEPAAAPSEPKVADLVRSAPPVADLVRSQPSFATSADSYYGAGQRALLSSIAKNFLGGGVAARAEIVPSLPRRRSEASLSDSTNSEADVPDRDIMALWYMEV